jgi:hypothetical protein
MATVLGAIDGGFDKNLVYDSSGRKWKSRGIESPYKRTWWRRLLAEVYNPIITVTVLWGDAKAYALDELKLAYRKAVDQDDDILTQFVEAEELKSRISQTKTFDQLIEVYRWMEADHDSTEKPA